MDGSCRPGVGIFKLFNNIFTVFPKARLVVELLYSKLRSNGFSCHPVLFKNQVSDLIDWRMVALGTLVQTPDKSDTPHILSPYAQINKN